MDILVCVKQIQHTYTRTGKDPETTYINPEDSIFRLNPYDEAAVELALRLKDKDKTIKISLLTIGGLIAEDELRRCLATGADHLYRIDQNPDSRSTSYVQPDPLVKAGLITSSAKQLGTDLILCGKESRDRANGHVGSLVAGFLDLPFVSAITDLTIHEQNTKVRVKRCAGKGVRQILECSPPAVFSVDTGAELRLPTVAARQWAGNYEIQTLETETEASLEKLSIKKIIQPRPRPRLIPAPDSSMHSHDRIRQLLSGTRIEKKGEMLTGNTQSQIKGIIRYLKENEFIETKKSN